MFGELAHKMPSLLRMGTRLNVPTWQSSLVPGAIFSATSIPTVASNATSTLIGSGVGSLTLPPNFFQPGTTIVLEAFGTVVTPASASTLVFTVGLGGTTVANTKNGTVAAPTNSMAQGAPFSLRCMITCQTAGVGGTVIACGAVTIGCVTSNVFVTTADAATVPLLSGTTTPGTAAINTSLAQAITCTVTQATNTANTFSISTFLIYQLY